MSIITMENLDHFYLPGTPYAKRALQGLNLSLGKGEFLGIFGPNGSGKSTLAQHLNGLLLPTAGTISICGLNSAHPKSRRELWKKVSLVFQYPEQQIFQLTIYDEVAYGPRNMGLSETETRRRADKALKDVGLTLEDIAELSPFTLSGGMKRRVAIAGMLALQPEILVLDEPMAGLDPLGRKLIIDIIKARQQRNETTIMISHNLKEILPLADKIAILDDGILTFYGSAQQLSINQELLQKYHLQMPDYMQVIYALTSQGHQLPSHLASLAAVGEELIRICS